MKKILLVISLTILMLSSASAAEKVNIEKQLIGIIGAISGNVKTETRELKTGDKIYLNETILAGADSGTQILLLDQSTFTIGSDSEVVMDTFIYDPDTNDGKIIAEVKQGSLKVISGLISKKNPDSLTVKVPEGTLGSRGTEFQTMVSKKQTSTLLIGPGKNNTLGLRPGAVLVGNKLGSTLLNNPYSITTMQKGKAPGQAKKITKGQLKKFNKKMKALKVAKLEGVSKNEKKKIKAGIKKELEAAGLEKAEIKVLIKENIKKDKKKKAEKKKAIAKKKKAKKKNANLKNDKGKNKKANAKNKKKNKKKKAKAKKNKNNKKKKSNAKNKKNNKKKKSKAKNKKKNKSKAKAKNTKKNKPKPKAKNIKKNKPKPKDKSNKKKNKKKNKNKNKNKKKNKNKNKN